jgi:hypothetical protein
MIDDERWRRSFFSFSYCSVFVFQFRSEARRARNLDTLGGKVSMIWQNVLLMNKFSFFIALLEVSMTHLGLLLGVIGLVLMREVCLE